MKRFIAVTLAALTILSSSVFAADASRFVYDGEEKEITAPVIVKGEYTYLPAEQVFKAAGYKVIEKSSNNSLTVEALGKSGYVSVWVNQKKIRLNGGNLSLTVAPFRENGIVYVPSKFVEDQLGVKISYDSDKNTYYLDDTGEGEITSTVGKYTKKTTSSSKTSSSKTSSSSSNSSSGTVISNYSYIPDFTSVTGVAVSSHEGTYNKNNVQIGWSYVYNDATKDDMDKYESTLQNLGFTKVGEAYAGLNSDTTKREYKKGSEHVSFYHIDGIRRVNTGYNGSWSTGYNEKYVAVQMYTWVE